jgi:hypothetical protein
MKERARTTPRRRRNESFWDVRTLLSITTAPTRAPKDIIFHFIRWAK